MEVIRIKYDVTKLHVSNNESEYQENLCKFEKKKSMLIAKK